MHIHHRSHPEEWYFDWLATITTAVLPVCHILLQLQLLKLTCYMPSSAQIQSSPPTKHLTPYLQLQPLRKGKVGFFFVFWPTNTDSEYQFYQSNNAASTSCFCKWLWWERITGIAMDEAIKGWLQFRFPSNIYFPAYLYFYVYFFHASTYIKYLQVAFISPMPFPQYQP